MRCDIMRYAVVGKAGQARFGSICNPEVPKSSKTRVINSTIHPRELSGVSFGRSGPGRKSMRHLMVQTGVNIWRVLQA